MPLIKILVEGKTEYQFVEKILKSHLESCGYTVSVQINLTSSGCKGGISHYNQFKSNVMKIKKEAPECIFTTMIDLYGLPGSFPGKKDSANIQDSEKLVLFLEEKLKEDLKISDFIPYIQLHEFEALLFSDIDRIEEILCRSLTSKKEQQKLRENLKNIMKEYGSPEQINQSMGPSRRLEKIYNKFGKTVQGIEIAQAIGLGPMREACPHFNRWLNELETQAKKGS